MGAGRIPVRVGEAQRDPSVSHPEPAARGSAPPPCWDYLGGTACSVETLWESRKVCRVALGFALRAPPGRQGNYSCFVINLGHNFGKFRP